MHRALTGELLKDVRVPAISPHCRPSSKPLRTLRSPSGLGGSSIGGGSSPWICAVAALILGASSSDDLQPQIDFHSDSRSLWGPSAPAGAPSWHSEASSGIRSVGWRVMRWASPPP
eukprot:1462957-Pyramimonas_sp.AAC.1